MTDDRRLCACGDPDCDHYDRAQHEEDLDCARNMDIDAVAYLIAENRQLRAERDGAFQRAERAETVIAQFRRWLDDQHRQAEEAAKDHLVIHNAAERLRAGGVLKSFWEEYDRAAARQTALNAERPNSDTTRE